MTHHALVNSSSGSESELERIKPNAPVHLTRFDVSRKSFNLVQWRIACADPEETRRDPPLLHFLERNGSIVCFALSHCYYWRMPPPTQS